MISVRLKGTVGVFPVQCVVAMSRRSYVEMDLRVSVEDVLAETWQVIYRRNVTMESR